MSVSSPGKQRNILSSPALSGLVIAQLPKYTKLVTKIQANWRGHKQRANFYNELEKYAMQKTLLTRMAVPDELLMKQVQNEMRKKNLTMEEAFRAADEDCDGVVTCEELLKFFGRLKLGLTQAQVSRLLLILDEDFSGKIDRQEFYNALSAYETGVENHRSSQHTFEQETLMKVSQILEKRKIEPVEMFNLCDTDNSGIISLKELESSFEKLNMNLQRKEIFALMKILDKDRSGSLNKEEFLKIMQKGAQAFKIEAAISGTRSSVMFKPQGPAKKQEAMQVDEEVKAIVEKMEKGQHSLPEVLERVDDKQQGKVTINAFISAIKKYFPDLNKDEIMKLVGAFDIDKNSLIDISEVHQVLLVYSNQQLTFKQLLYKCALVVMTAQVPTSQYFTKQGIQINSQMTFEEFSETCETFFALNKEDSETLFKTLDINNEKKVEITHLITGIQNHRTDFYADEEIVLKTREELVSQHVDPKTQTSQNFYTVTKFLDKFEMKPMMIFRMADKEQKGVVLISDLVSAFARLMPSAPEEVQKAFESLFPDPQVEKDTYAIKIFRTQPDESLGAIDENKDSNGLTVGQVYWLRKFLQAGQEVNKTKEVIWHAADTDRDNLINAPQLTGAITQQLPDSLSSMDIISIIAAFETNDLTYDIYAKKLNAAESSTHSASALADFDRQRNLKTSPQKPKPKPQPIPGRPAPPNRDDEPRKQITMGPPGSLPLSFYEHGLFQTQDIAILLNNFTSQQFGPNTIFNKNYFKMHFTKPPYSLNDSFAQDLFSSLDCHKQQAIYTYNLLCVLDSYRDPNAFVQFPVAQNERAANDGRHMWGDLARSLTKSVQRLLGNNLSQKLTDADWQGPLTKKLNIQCDYNQLKVGFPPNACWYHVAVVLNSYIETVELSTEQIMTQVFKIGGTRCGAYEFFNPDNYNDWGEFEEVLSLDFTLDSTNFYEVIGPPLQLTEPETAQLYRGVYTKATGQKPVGYFFTYYDMVLSTFNGDEQEYPFPRMPMPYRSSLPPKTQDLFKQLCQKPTDEYMYGPYEYTEWDLICQYYQQGLQPEQSRTIFQAMKMNAGQKVMNYHLETVYAHWRDSMGVQPQIDPYVDLSLKRFYGNCLATWCDMDPVQFLESKGLKLTEQISWERMADTMSTPMTKEYIKRLWDLLRGKRQPFIYVYQIAGFIDVLQRNGQLGDYPIRDNVGAPQHLKEFLQSEARYIHPDVQTFFKQNRQLNINLTSTLSSPIEVQQLYFRSTKTLDLIKQLCQTCIGRSSSPLNTYTLLACLESYPPYDHEGDTWIPRVFKELAMQCTTKYACDWLSIEHKLNPLDIISRGEFPDSLISLVGYPGDLDEGLMFIDTQQFGRCYVHQLGTLIDIAGRKPNLGSLPMIQNKHHIIHLTPSLTRLQNKIQSNAYMFFNEIFPDPNALIKKWPFVDYMRSYLGNFLAVMPEFPDDNTIDLFTACQIEDDFVVIYHFLSAVQSWCLKSPTPEIPNKGEGLHYAMLEWALVIDKSNKTTPEFFQMHSLQPGDAIQGKKLEEVMTQAFKAADTNIVNALGQRIDRYDSGVIFAYELFLQFDLYRARIVEGEYGNNMPVDIPWPKDAKQMEIFRDYSIHNVRCQDVVEDNSILQREAAALNQKDVATIKGYGFDESQYELGIGHSEFTRLVKGNPQDVQILFSLLAFGEADLFPLYHFLALLESYRRQQRILLSHEDSGKSGYNQAHVDPPVQKELDFDKSVEMNQEPTVNSELDPLTDALTKLKDFMLKGWNGRPFTSRDLFGMFDKNKDGVITEQEFLDAMNRNDLALTENQRSLLLNTADLNKNGRVDYDEFCKFLLSFQDEPSIASFEDPELFSVKHRPITDIQGLDRNINFEDLAKDPEQAIKYAIYTLKLYTKSNYGTSSAIENVFFKLDDETEGYLSETAFLLALERLKLGFTAKQKESLLKIVERTPPPQNDLKYKEFIDVIYDYDMEGSLIQFVHKDDLDNSRMSQGAGSLIANSLKPHVQQHVKSEVHISTYRIIPEEDCFNEYHPGWTTILNSEIAALKRCTELLNGQTLFEDPDFHPTKHEGKLLYWTGNPPTANHPNPKEISWLRPSEFLPANTPGKFRQGGISSNDVKQGSLGDCWFIGALSVLATRDELVYGSGKIKDIEDITKETVIGLSKGVYPPIFHVFAKKGLYVFRFFKNCAWKYVIIDNRIPMYNVPGYEKNYIFGHCTDQAELWVPLIEKAYAKLHGCYESLSGGLLDDGLVDLTGLVAEKTNVVKETESQEGKEGLWRKLLDFRSQKSLMGCSIDSNEVEGEVRNEDGDPTGLISRHAYAVLDILYVKNPKATKKRNRLIRVRNPWGEKEWIGPWSDGSTELTSNLDKVMTEVNKLGADEKFNPNDSNDGTFLMCYSDWRSLYNNLFTCVDFPDNWSGVRFKSKWTIQNSGGVPNGPSTKQSKKWAKNPQFYLDVGSPTEIFISLTQCDGRFIHEIQFPYEKFTHAACFAIMRLSPDEKSVSMFENEKIQALSTLKLHREVSLRLQLDRGRYSIVPATQNDGEEGTFYLSIYHSCEKQDIRFEDGDGEPPSVIEEEEEIDPMMITDEHVKSVKSLVQYLKNV